MREKVMRGESGMRGNKDHEKMWDNDIKRNIEKKLKY